MAGSASADPIGTRWPQPGGPGTPIIITYSYSNLLDGAFLLVTPAELRAATEEALSLWARFAPLHFVERPDSGPAPSDTWYEPGVHPIIRFGHHATTERAHGFYPNDFDGLAGDVHLATGAPWTIGGPFDVLETMIHEAGHALGLGHELVQLSVMNPVPAQRFNGPGTAFLFPIDVLTIQRMYGAGEGSVSPVPEPTTLLLIGSGGMGLRLARRRRSAIVRAARSLDSLPRKPHVIEVGDG
jgi:hypothetical protein